MIKIVGLGYGEASITLGGLKAMEKSNKVFLRSSKLAVAKAVKKLGIEFDTFDRLYEETQDFDLLNTKIAEAIIASGDGTVYAVSGSGLEDTAVNEIKRLATEAGLAVEVIPSVSRSTQMLSLISHTERYTAVSATDFTTPDVRQLNIITDIDNRLLAGDIKCRLLDYYPEEHQILFFPTDSHKVHALPLYELDRQTRFGHNCSIALPALDFDATEQYDYQHLLDIMARLRSPEGCPWDREQTHASIRQNMIEEAYEVVEAIDAGELDSLYDELGDCLLQVVFHAQMADECGEFNHRDVTTAVCRKLIRRHPHIFGNVQADTSEQVLKNWDQIKKQEKELSSQSDVLRAVSPALPALIRSYKVQSKAADVGFDWPDISGALDKVHEEICELEAEIKANNSDLAAEELGDLLFSVVNVARFMGTSPELALIAACEKFIKRFEAVEKKLADKGISMRDCTLEQLDNVWNLVK
jgi:tetrapyrrole methylase family protein/MazG family protein